MQRNRVTFRNHSGLDRQDDEERAECAPALNQNQISKSTPPPTSPAAPLQVQVAQADQAVAVAMAPAAVGPEVVAPVALAGPEAVTVASVAAK